MTINCEYLEQIQELCDQEFIVISAHRDIGEEDFTWTFRMEFTSRPILTISHFNLAKVYEALQTAIEKHQANI